MNNIKSLRKAKNYTQKELADLLDIKQTSISKWELDISLPDTVNLMKLSEIFNVSTDYILGISRFHYPVNVGVDNIFTFEELEIIEDYRKLSSEYQETIKQTLKAFVNTSETK